MCLESRPRPDIGWVQHTLCVVWAMRLVVSDSLRPMDCNPPGSSVHGIFQARILEWIAISYSRGSSPTQGSNPHLLHWHLGSLRRSHQEVPTHIICSHNSILKITIWGVGLTELLPSGCTFWNQQGLSARAGEGLGSRRSRGGSPVASTIPSRMTTTSNSSWVSWARDISQKGLFSLIS